MALSVSAILISAIISCAFSLERWLDEFEYHTFMGGSDDKYEIYWNADQDGCMLEIGLAVQTDGWVGFGISQGQGMEGADIIIGWIPSNNPNSFVIRNYQGSQGSVTEFDDQSGIEPIEGWKEDIDGTTMTYIRFNKEMFPDFIDGGVSIEIGTTKVIWAYRDGELTSESVPGWHGRSCIDNPENIVGCRSVESMNLLQGESAEVPLPEDALEHTVFMPNVDVPDASTTYYCSLLELPTPDEKHQVVQIDPMIQEENIGIVHHMLLYACPESKINQSHVGTGSDCDMMNENMPGVYCRGGVVFFGWAIGGKSYYFPENVGLDVGGNEYDTIKYVLLETHYDNPTNRDDIFDSSGLRLWYTPTLREYSAATLQIGMDAWPGGQFIPPGIERAVNYGYCYTECLDPGIDGTEIDGENKIYAFANTLHTHLLGRQVVLRHIRNGEELRPIDMNLAYDFDYQQMTPFEQIEIIPGDQLIVECVYDSSERNIMTYGGESTYDEMCLSFLMVYPKPKLAMCTTSYLGWPNEEGEWQEDIGRFFQEAAANGYYDASTDFYDVEVEGALEFYQDFATGNIFANGEEGGALRSQSCLDSQHDILEGHGHLGNVLRPDIEFNSFDDDDYYICIDNETLYNISTTDQGDVTTTDMDVISTTTGGDDGADESGSNFDWNGWYVYAVASLLGVILIVLTVYIAMKCKSSRNGKDENYHRVLGQENNYNNYGSNDTDEVAQISMQGRT